MLILFGRDRRLAPTPTDTNLPRPGRCTFVQHATAYSARRIEPRLRERFEQHLMECGPCQRAVHLGRISNLLNHHNRSVGQPCATPTRRKS